MRALLGTTRLRLLLAAGAIVVAVAVAISIVVATSSSPRHHAISFTHAQYAQSYSNATVGKMTIDDLSAWPTPYQSYTDQYHQHCYEWWDRGHVLYNLCFSTKGLLALKAIE